MRRTAILFVLAIFVVAISASVAYAAWQNAGYAPNWDDFSGGDPSPHAGYTTTSTKCFVCHAVHNASDVGEALLNDTVAGACDYCHVSLTCAYTMVYGGDPDNYNPDTIYNHGGNGVAAFDKDTNNQNVQCSDCHAVHGASTMSTQTGSPNILKLQSDPATGYVDPGTSYDLAAYCSYCHPYFIEGYNDVSHVMTTNVAAYGNTQTSQNGNKVAWTASDECYSCHDDGRAGASVNESGFPHWTPGAPRFISSGTVTTVSGAQRVVNDGVCLKCHLSGATGVGQTF